MDTLSNGMSRELARQLSPWISMWRHAIPRIEADSLRRGRIAAAFREGYVQSISRALSYSGEGAGEWEVLGAVSPKGRYRLIFDRYQVIDTVRGRIEIGGEPDSAPLLIDLGRGLANQFEFCGTSCGYHWGCWTDSTHFALAGWTETDARGDSLSGFLSVYSLVDSTELTYFTRSVHRRAFEKYRDAWEAWVRDRFLARAGSRPSI